MMPYGNATGYTVPIFGTGISFAARGPCELSGIPDQWPLFAVARSG